MSKILHYARQYETELIALMKNEPDWHSFTRDEAIEKFRNSLLDSETFVCVSNNTVCGYVRALVDGFGIYISELYIAPTYRNNGYGKELLNRIREEYPDQQVYVLSDEDVYYKKLGLKCIGFVFQL